MSNIIPFHYHQKSIRVIRDNNEDPWFVAREVSDVLNIRWRGKSSLSRIQDKWTMTTEIPDPKGRLQKTILINEPALYKLAFRSNKPEAEEFTDWVASEVLPQIRKTGSYGQSHPERVSFTKNQLINEGWRRLEKQEHIIEQLIKGMDCQEELIALLKAKIDQMEEEERKRLCREDLWKKVIENG